ncbi:PREDICTED: sodium/potassium/calcium exchanger 1-like, partial [Vollenhovia emeryi]|uniref:sodium/potassium/calcium exchanger 1-like n=1 Tax=Vollenhovia emeryi TaxID=411798 RepID=UPI0005F38A99
MNKDKDFWEGIRKWDIIYMSETWVQKKGWEKVKRWLPKGYRWEIQEAGKKNKKGRAIGGIVMGRREETEIEGEVEEDEEEGMMIIKVKIGKEWWRIIGVYVNKNLDRKIEKLRKWMENREEGVKTLIGGDFNARTGTGGGGEEGDEERVRGRKSRDEKSNGEGRRLCRFLEEMGWSIMNGNTEGDEEGEWTYTGGRGGTVIDYVVGDRETRRSVKRLLVEENTESDHQPLT